MCLLPIFSTLLNFSADKVLMRPKEWYAVASIFRRFFATSLPLDVTVYAESANANSFHSFVRRASEKASSRCCVDSNINFDLQWAEWCSESVCWYKVKYVDEDHFRVSLSLPLHHESKPLHEPLFISTSGLLSGCCFSIAAHACIENQEKSQQILPGCLGGLRRYNWMKACAAKQNVTKMLF